MWDGARRRGPSNRSRPTASGGVRGARNADAFGALSSLGETLPLAKKLPCPMGPRATWAPMAWTPLNDYL
eukprot:8785457-Lingulodinium_polyedra.AAC.1